MIPLLTASVVVMTVILERLFFWRRLRVRRGEPGILAMGAEGDPPQAMQLASASRHPVARVLGAIMTLNPHNYFRPKVEQLTDMLDEQSTRLELLLGKREA
jgi:hypothetical protein